jgi:hypothetical protein
MPYSTTNALTPTQRRKEIAAILGRGLLRLNAACGHQPASANSAHDSPEPV